MGRHRAAKRRAPLTCIPRPTPVRKSRRRDCTAGMQDTPVLGGAQGTTVASSEPPPHTSSPSPASSSVSAESPLHTPPPSRRRTRLSDPVRNIADSSVIESCEENNIQDCSPATSSSAGTSSAPLVASAPSSPVTPPPQESPPPPSSSDSDHQAAESSTITTECDLPTNLTGARKRKAHRVVKRETSSEGGSQVGEPERGSSSTEETLTCPVCETVLTSQSEFTAHIRGHNVEPSSSLATPPGINNNNNKVFSCSLCGKMLSSSSSLDRHMLVHSGERPFKCRICSVAFTTNGNMHRHMRTHNNNTSSVNNNHAHHLVDSDGSSDGASERNMSRKRRSNGDLNVPSPKKRTEEGHVSPPVAAVPPESCLSCQRCDKCFMTFNSERELSLHRYAAHAPHDDEPIIEERKVSSGPAQVGFKDLNFVDFSTDKFPLIARAFCERSVHKASSVIHRFQCEECGRAFPCGSALHIHVTSAHTETSPRDLSCPRRKLHYEEQKEDFFAGLDLQTKSPSSSPPPTSAPTPIKVRAFSELATPRREEEQPEQPEPPRDLADIPSILSVANRGALDLAKSPNSSSDEGLRQMKLRGEFPCRLCTAVFPNLRALKGHNRVHLSTGPPYYCNMCVYNSNDKATLVRHLRTHNGERPFECRLCHYAFTTKANCERHLRNRHNKTSREDVRRSITCHMGEDATSEKPHECAICERSFPSRSTALSHAAREHPTSTATELVRLGADPEEIEDEAELLMSPGNSPRPQDRSSSPSSEEEPRRDAPSPLDLSMDALDLSKKPCAPLPVAPVANIPPQEAPQDLTKPKESHAPVLPPHHIPHLPHFLAHHPGLPTPSPHSAFFPNPLSMYLGSPFQRPPFPFYMPLFGNSPSPAATPPPPPPTAPTSSALDEVKEQLQKELIRGLQLTSGGSLVMDALRKPAPEPPRASPPPKPAPEPRPDPPVKMVIKNGVLMPKQKQRRYRTERPFACEHCSARFTLRSNMERHVKQQHPQFWSQRPRGGRRSAPARPPPSPLPTPQPEITLLGESRISDEVKHALTQQLKQKLTSDDGTSAARRQEAEDAAVEGDVDEEDEPELVIDEAPQRRSPRDGDADLASVSRLLVNASAQNFQHYFPGHEEDDEEEEGFMEGDDEDEGVLDDGSSSEGGPLTSGDEGRGSRAGAPLSPGRVKKKSAYSSAPNRVTCPYCHRKFPWSSSLRRHILTHTGQKPFKCAHCPLLFTTKSNCDRHLLRKHSKKSASPPSSAPTTPIPPPPPPPPSEESYLMRNVPERPFKCNLCPSSTFSTERNLRKHVSSKHSGKRMPSNSPPTPTTSTSTTTPPSSGKDAQSAADSGRGASPDPLPASSDSTSPPAPSTLTCYKCNQTFSSEARLTAHLESHSDLPFKCHLCENSYAERQEALEHIRTSHAAEYELLVSKGALDPHAEDCTANAPPASLNNNNNNEAGDDTLETLRGKFPDYANRKVMCAFCMRRFWSAEDLRRHMRTHTGERPFTCDICWRKFTLKHSMLRHRKKHATHGGFAMAASNEQACSDDDAQSTDSAREGLRRWAEHAGLAMYSGTATALQSRLAGLQGRNDQPSEEHDLIGNLLGIKDRAMIDHMLSKSADDAAKLLGVSSQR